MLAFARKGLRGASLGGEVRLALAPLFRPAPDVLLTLSFPLVSQ
jgi:hypothetical protein